MHYSEIKEIKERWVHIHKLLIELMQKEVQVKRLGIARVIAEPQDENKDPVEYLEQFDSDFNKIITIADLYSAQCKNQLTTLEGKGMSDALLNLSVFIKINRSDFSRLRLHSPILQITTKILNPFIGANFISEKRSPEIHELYETNNEMGFRKMSVFLSKAIGSSDRLAKAALDTVLNDDDLFKPSAIDKNVALEKLTEARAFIKLSDSLSATDKITLINYLDTAIRETKSSKPAWPTIIGALVIVSTLIGGVASLEEASRNINSAVTYIMGSSAQQITELNKGPINVRNIGHDDVSVDKEEP